MTATVRAKLLGSPFGRREDQPLLTGTAQFVADVRPEGVLEAAFVRSMIAHARINSIQCDVAAAIPNVVKVATASDLVGVNRYPHYLQFIKDVAGYPLARDRVRYVGMPVAVVVAEDRYRAEDAAERIVVDYEELPVVSSALQSIAEDAPLLYDNWPDNRLLDFPVHRPEVEEAFRSYPYVEDTFVSQRQSPSPMETRGVVADYRRGRLTVWSSTQSPHILRTTLAELLGLAESRVRVITPSVGGGFGAKVYQYPEEIVVSWLSMQLGRPVKWIEDRFENLVSSIHAREQLTTVAAAYDPDDGTIKALRGRVLTDVGSGEVYIPGTATSLVSAACLPGAYRIPHVAMSIICAVTNKTPSGAYRGFGEPEAVFAMERIVEMIAKRIGQESHEIRRRMLYTAGEHPVRLASGAILDSGSHLEAYERAVEIGRASLERATAAARHRPDVRVGVGFAPYIEACAPTYFGTTGRWTSYDAATVRIDPDGGATVSVGMVGIGQGTETLVTTIIADELHMDPEQITVLTGDTDTCPYGLGAWGARGTVVLGGALQSATAAVRAKAIQIAAGLLESAAEDIEFEAGEFFVRGTPSVSVSFRDVANVAYTRTVDLAEGVTPGLDVTVTFDPPGLDHQADIDGKMNAAATWSNATHGAVVEVDLCTGLVKIVDYIVVHDCGTVLNPDIVQGQIEGGVAQGVAGALYEHMVYDQQGQPQSASFMDYLVPTATEIPPVTMEHIETPAPHMPYGAKGMGESGTIGVCAAVGNAVADALREFDVHVNEMPITPAQVLAWVGADRTNDDSWGERAPVVAP